MKAWRLSSTGESSGGAESRPLIAWQPHGSQGRTTVVRDSGERQWHGAIAREGDAEMRCLLVQAAHAALNCRRGSALKLWAEQLAERVGKRKAVVALARKFAVLLHRLWVTDVLISLCRERLERL